MIDKKAEEKILAKIEKIEEEAKLNLPPEPLIETKDLRTESEAGRLVQYISPKGQTFYIRKDRADLFEKRNGVDRLWIKK